MSYLDARSWFELPASERQRTIDWLREWDHKPKLLADFLSQLEKTIDVVDGVAALVDAITHDEIRESGGSRPAECPCGEGKNPLHALLKSHQPPVLNKSGGSDVEGK